MEKDVAGNPGSQNHRSPSNPSPADFSPPRTRPLRPLKALRSETHLSLKLHSDIMTTTPFLNLPSCPSLMNRMKPPVSHPPRGIRALQSQVSLGTSGIARHD